MSQITLANALYKGHSVPEVLKIYEKDLKASGDLIDRQHATFISKYRRIVTDRKYLGTLRKHFTSFYKLIDKQSPDTLFYLEGRRKALFSTEKKIIKLLNDGRSLDNLRDIIAFRIIIFDNGNAKQGVDLCYCIMEKIIRYGIENGFMLCQANPVEGTADFNKNIHNIFVPENSGIPQDFQYGVKDYILHPKKEGYQSLHATFRLASGHVFEVQIRTLSMHMHAESGVANHSTYKAKKYQSSLNIDRTKINIPGYGIGEDGKVYDMIGLENALSVMQRQKTFK